MYFDELDKYIGELSEIIRYAYPGDTYYLYRLREILFFLEKIRDEES